MTQQPFQVIIEKEQSVSLDESTVLFRSNMESKVTKRGGETGTDLGLVKHTSSQERQSIHFPPTFLYSRIQKIWVSSSKCVLKLKKPVVMKRDSFFPSNLVLNNNYRDLCCCGRLNLQMQKHLKD